MLETNNRNLIMRMVVEIVELLADTVAVIEMMRDLRKIMDMMELLIIIVDHKVLVHLLHQEIQIGVACML